jgi:putative resolvase
MNDTFSIGDAAKKLGKTVKTLQRWDRAGLLKAIKTPTGRRVYTLQKLREAMGLADEQQERRAVAYCRVSSQAQRPDLKNQRRVVEDFCVAKGLANVEFIEEIGGGLNFKRPLFLKLVDQVVAGDISKLILAHKDRLARFGFELLSHLCRKHQCEMLVIDNQQLSPEVEMVNDLMAITHCFSSRLYGLRNYKKALKEALK